MLYAYICHVPRVVVYEQASEVRVNFVVMRHLDAIEEGGDVQSRGARRVPDAQYFRRHSTFMKVKRCLVSGHYATGSSACFKVQGLFSSAAVYTYVV